MLYFIENDDKIVHLGFETWQNKARLQSVFLILFDVGIISLATGHIIPLEVIISRVEATFQNRRIKTSSAEERICLWWRPESWRQ